MAAFPRHVCSAFCRDGRHAEVISMTTGSRAAVERYPYFALAAALSRIYGVRVVRVEPAPEARPFADTLADCDQLAALPAEQLRMMP